jgi:hypothetical protein
MLVTQYAFQRNDTYSKASDPKSPLRHSVLEQLSHSVSRNSSVFHAGFSDFLAFDMVLTVRPSISFTMPLSANLRRVSSAFITVAASGDAHGGIVQWRQRLCGGERRGSRRAGNAAAPCALRT